MKILAIVGSPRLRGNSNYLVDRALEEAARVGIETEKIVLNQYQVAPCQGHDNCASFSTCQQKDDAEWILEKFRDADGVILGTPVYYYDVTAQMKAFIDRSYFLYTHNVKSKAKAVGVIVVAESSGIEYALRTLNLFIGESFNVTEDSIFIISGYASKPGDAKKNPSLVEEARRLGRHMVDKLTGRK